MKIAVLWGATPCSLIYSTSVWQVLTACIIRAIALEVSLYLTDTYSVFKMFPSILTLLEITVSTDIFWDSWDLSKAFHNIIKCFIFGETSPTIVIVVKHLVQLWDTLLHSNLTRLKNVLLSTLTIHRHSSHQLGRCCYNVFREGGGAGSVLCLTSFLHLCYPRSFLRVKKLALVWSQTIVPHLSFNCALR
jgi:hypothetical protein